MRRIRHLLVTALLVVPLTVVSAPALAQQDTSGPGSILDRQWHLRDSLSGGPATTSFYYGAVDDTSHMLCDWNGDGTRTPAVIRWDNDHPRWLVRNSLSGGSAHHSFVYGRFGDRPVCGDWNGDGTQTPGVVREDDQGRLQWFLRNSVSGGAADVSLWYGRDTTPGELPPIWVFAGDWNGDGRDTPGMVRGHDDGQFQWLLRDALSGGPATSDFVYYDDAVFGDHLEIHVPVVGDWNGDGQDSPGVARKSGSQSFRWLLRDDRSAGTADHVFRYGPRVATDIPVTWR